MLVEGEDINFPVRPEGVPTDYVGVAIHVSYRELAAIIAWVIEDRVFDRGLYSDHNGHAANYTPFQWLSNLEATRRIGEREAEELGDPRWVDVKLKTARYYFGDPKDAVAFRLKFG